MSRLCHLEKKQFPGPLCSSCRGLRELAIAPFVPMSCCHVAAVSCCVAGGGCAIVLRCCIAACVVVRTLRHYAGRRKAQPKEQSSCSNFSSCSNDDVSHCVPRLSKKFMQYKVSLFFSEMSTTNHVAASDLL